MTEEQKELLKEKLKLFNEKLDSLTKKYENDINLIEELKYFIYDSVIIPYKEIEELHPKEKEKKEEEKKEKKPDKKEEKKSEIKKEIKEPLSKTINISSTPKKQNKKREIDFKGKTEVIPKKSKIFSGKTHKPELTTSQVIPEKPKKKNLISAATEPNKKKENIRTSKTPLNKKDKVKDKEEKKEKDNKDNKIKKNKAISVTAYKPSATKRFTAQKKTIDKKGKPEKKKIEKKKDIKKTDKKAKDTKEEEKKEKAKNLEEKIDKIIVLKDKTINKIPDDLKNNNALFNFFLVVKGNYLSKKDNFKLILSSPKIYKAFGNDIKFLLDDKKNELKAKISELQTFFNRYDDLPNILSKEFHPSPSSLKSLLFVTKDELESLIKKGNIPKEFIKIFKIFSYMLDIEFDANLSDEDLMKFFISELIVKFNAKNLQHIITDYISKYKDMNLTKEKVDKIENIITSDSSIINIIDMAKINRLVSYCSLFIKDFHEFITLKTSDEIPYYEFKNKNKIFQELKKKLATIENNGIPPNTEEETKEEIIEEKKEKKEEIKEEIKEEKIEIVKDEVKKEDDNKKEEVEENKIVENEENKTEEIKENISPVIENQLVEEQTVITENKEEN